MGVRTIVTIPLEFVYRKSWRSARRRDGRSDKTKAQRVLELGATALCDDARDILDELQERWNRLLDPRQPPWTIQVKSANSASTSAQLLVERIRAAKTLQSAGERSNLRLASGKVRTPGYNQKGYMQEESPKRLGKEKGGDSARQRLGLTAQYHSIRDPETSSSSFPSTDSPGEAAIMTSPPHRTGRFIDAVPSDQLQIAGEPAESSGLHQATQAIQCLRQTS